MLGTPVCMSIWTLMELEKTEHLIIKIEPDSTDLWQLSEQILTSVSCYKVSEFSMKNFM